MVAMHQGCRQAAGQPPAQRGAKPILGAFARRGKRQKRHHAAVAKGVFGTAIVPQGKEFRRQAMVRAFFDFSKIKVTPQPDGNMGLGSWPHFLFNICGVSSPAQKLPLKVKV